LDLTRIESGKKIREIREVDLGLIAKSAIDTMKPLAIQHNVRIEFDPSISIPFIADPEEMDIIFNNLVSNAVKYNIDGGKVVCNIDIIGTDILIKISDTGVGIAQDDIPKLFNEFSRIKNQMTKDVSGSGLGLSIVKRIVDLYSGKIEVESRQGVETTFCIFLPITSTST
jgi:signal transduction histidine kinase